MFLTPHATVLRLCPRSDCTHYCYTPQLWKTFFNSVFEAHEKVAQAAR